MINIHSITNIIFHILLPSLHPVDDPLSQVSKLLLVLRVFQILDTLHGSLAVLGGKLLGLLQPPGAGDQLEGSLHIPRL